MTTLQTLPEEISQHLQAQGVLHTHELATEPAASVQQALPRITEVVLSGLAELAGQQEGREQLWHLTQEATEVTSGGPAVATPVGAGLLKSVIADRYHGTVHGIAAATGLKAPAVTRLMDLATGAALERLASLAAEHHWTAQQLSAWLLPHRAAPVAMPLATEAGAAATIASPLLDTPAGASWFANRTNLLLLAVSFIAVGELGYILGQHSVPETVVATTGTAGTTDAGNAQRAGGGRAYTAIPMANISPASRPASPTTVPVPVVLKLKNGLRQVIGATSTESKLYQFLIDPSKEVDATDPTKDWIGFDRIYFDPNKATLTNESLWQLSNVASILKRFPEAKIKLGGYTDNTGHPFSNLQLSKARAQAALDALVSLGVPAPRLVAAGYGQLDNIADNATEEGRSVNRRVSMQVTQK